MIVLCKKKLWLFLCKKKTLTNRTSGENIKCYRSVEYGPLSVSAWFHIAWDSSGLSTCGFNGSFSISLHILAGGHGAVWAVWTGSQEPTETYWRGTPCYSGPPCCHRKHTGASDTNTTSRGEEGHPSFVLSYFHKYRCLRHHFYFLNTVSLKKHWYQLWSFMLCASVSQSHNSLQACCLSYYSPRCFASRPTLGWNESGHKFLTCSQRV